MPAATAACGRLFFTTLSTLILELLDARLLSVLTWYHLSFLAISVAMLGMAAGAILVFLAGDRLKEERARRVLPRAAYLLGVAIPLTHLVLVRTRIPAVTAITPEAALPFALATVLLTIPFFVSGVVVTMALTRSGGRIGVLYGYDLVGAAAGCLVVIPILGSSNVISAALLAGAIAAVSAATTRSPASSSTRSSSTS